MRHHMTPGVRMMAGLTTGIVALVGTGAFGQDKQPPPPPPPSADLADDSRLNDPSVDEMKRELERRADPGRLILPRPAATVQPVVPGRPLDSSLLPGLNVTEAPKPTGRLIAEGTFLWAAPGRLYPLPETDDIVFIPDEETGSGPNALLLMPSRMRERLETTLGPGRHGTSVRLTGEVFVYLRRNHLLVTAFAAGGSDARPNGAANGNAADGTPQSQLDPRVQELIRDLEQQRGTPRMLGRETAETPLDDDGAVREGDLLLRRRGRMVRTAGGEWAVALDNGPAGEALTLMPLAPCRTAQAMEQRAVRLGDSWTFEISGRLLRFRGRTHLLPTMYVTLPPTETTPMQ